MTPEMKKYIDSPRFVDDMIDNFYASIHNILNTEEKVKLAGQDAMEYISDYPLYAGTSNITYDEAIMVALCTGWNYKDALDRLKIDYKETTV